MYLHVATKNWCTPKQLFLVRIKGLKYSPKILGNTLSDALLKSRFQNFAAAAEKNRPSCCFFRRESQKQMMHTFKFFLSGTLGAYWKMEGKYLRECSRASESASAKKLLKLSLTLLGENGIFTYQSRRKCVGWKRWVKMRGWKQVGENKRVDLSGCFSVYGNICR